MTLVRPANVRQDLALVEGQPVSCSGLLAIFDREPPSCHGLHGAGPLVPNVVSPWGVEAYCFCRYKPVLVVCPADAPLALISLWELDAEYSSPSGKRQDVSTIGRSAYCASLRRSTCLQSGGGRPFAEVAHDVYQVGGTRRLREVKVVIIRELAGHFLALNHRQARDVRERARMPGEMRKQLALAEEHRCVVGMSGLALLDAQKTAVDLLTYVFGGDVALGEETQTEADIFRYEVLPCWRLVNTTFARPSDREPGDKTYLRCSDLVLQPSTQVHTRMLCTSQPQYFPQQDPIHQSVLGNSNAKPAASCTHLLLDMFDAEPALNNLHSPCTEALELVI